MRPFGYLETLRVIRIVLGQQTGNFLTQYSVQLVSTHILVARHTFLNPTDNLQCRVHTHIARNEHLLQIVQHIIIHLRLSSHSAGNLAKHALLRLGESVIQRLLLFLGEHIKKSHIFFLSYTL